MSKEILEDLLKELKCNRSLFSLGHAPSAPGLPGGPEPDPFSSVSVGKIFFHTYAWQAQSAILCTS